jgi:hypothetical protein
MGIKAMNIRAILRARRIKIRVVGVIDPKDNDHNQHQQREKARKFFH